MNDIYIEIEDRPIEIDMVSGAISPAPTAENDFYIGDSLLKWAIKTLAQVKTILGLGSAAYTDSTDYATAAHLHDDRYYTETETDTLLTGKAATSHTHTQSQVASDAFQNVAFASPFLNLMGATYKDFICLSVTGSAEIRLYDVVNGDSGMIELIIDSTGGYTLTLGSMFVKRIGDKTLSGLANKDNWISYRCIGTQIIEDLEVPVLLYTIEQTV